MNIHACQKQLDQQVYSKIFKLWDYICNECHGLILLNQNKRAIYAEHFLLCQCFPS